MRWQLLGAQPSKLLLPLLLLPPLLLLLLLLLLLQACPLCGSTCCTTWPSTT
jgi:hypothetical protein